jgi:integrase
MLTDSKCKASKPRDKLYRKLDSSGLYLEITPTGKRHWRWRFLWQEKQSWATIGEYPLVTLAEARAMRDECRALLKRGLHPVKHANRQKANTFKTIAEEYLDDKATVWAPRTLEQRKRLLDREIYPNIGSRPIRDITPADVLALIQNVEKDRPAQAQFCRQVISAVFVKAISTLRADQDPTVPLQRALKPRVVKHAAVMMPADIRDFFEKLETSACFPSTRIAAELLWLTTVRSVELLEARWSELDLEARLWTIPADRMKRRREHIVPLTDRIVELLQQAKPLARNSGFIFPQTRGDITKPCNRLLFGKVWDTITRRQGESFGRFSPHGVRGCFSTWAHSVGYASEIVERQLSHTDRNTTRASYNQSQYLDQRLKMLEEWQFHLDRIRAGKGGKVLPSRTKTAD